MVRKRIREEQFRKLALSIWHESGLYTYVSRILGGQGHGRDSPYCRPEIGHSAFVGTDPGT